LLKCLVKFFVFSLCALIFADCGGSAIQSVEIPPDGGFVSAETTEEALISTAIDVLNTVASSAVAPSATSFSALKKYPNQDLLFAVEPNFLRSYCSESSALSENSSPCNSSNNSMSRTVSFADCQVGTAESPAEVNGSFTASILNGGSGTCTSSTQVSFANMVTGSGASYSYNISEGALELTFTNGNTAAEELSVSGTLTESYHNSNDSNNDGMADSASSSLVLSLSYERRIQNSLIHQFSAFTSAESFSAQNASAGTITVAPTLPVFALSMSSSTGRINTRNMISGHLIVDDLQQNIRVVFAVNTESGLVFNEGSSCGPVSGRLDFTAYQIGSDGSIGLTVATGRVVFEDGAIFRALYNGASISPDPRPCF